jgi:hypothetical protein
MRKVNIPMKKGKKMITLKNIFEEVSSRDIGMHPWSRGEIVNFSRILRDNNISARIYMGEISHKNNGIFFPFYSGSVDLSREIGTLAETGKIKLHMFSFFPDEKREVTEYGDIVLELRGTRYSFPRAVLGRMRFYNAKDELVYSGRWCYEKCYDPLNQKYIDF